MADEIGRAAAGAGGGAAPGPAAALSLAGQTPQFIASHIGQFGIKFHTHGHVELLSALQTLPQSASSTVRSCGEQVL